LVDRVHSKLDFTVCVIFCVNIYSLIVEIFPPVHIEITACWFIMSWHYHKIFCLVYMSPTFFKRSSQTINNILVIVSSTHRHHFTLNSFGVYFIHLNSILNNWFVALYFNSNRMFFSTEIHYNWWHFYQV